VRAGLMTVFGGTLALVAPWGATAAETTSPNQASLLMNVGAIATLLGIVAFFRYLPPVLSKIGEWLHTQERWSILWLAPMLFGGLYATYSAAQELPPEIAQSIALVLTLIESAILKQMTSAYPATWQRMKRWLYLGLPAPVMVAGYSAAYLGLLAWKVPGTVTGFSGAVGGAVALSIGSYYLFRSKSNKEGQRRTAVLIGHTAIAGLTVACQHTVPYAADYLGVLLQVYFALVLTYVWATLLDDLTFSAPADPTLLPTFLTLPLGGLCATPFAVGALALALGYIYAAGIFASCGVLLTAAWAVGVWNRHRKQSS
jgi:hypothetical protein